MRFSATEVGFENGLGGASNASSNDPYHYILFGRQSQPMLGVYFEFDDQINGEVDAVSCVSIGSEHIEFTLKTQPIIVARGNTSEAKWQELIRGIHETFPPAIVQSTP